MIKPCEYCNAPGHEDSVCCSRCLHMVDGPFPPRTGGMRIERRALVVAGAVDLVWWGAVVFVDFGAIVPAIMFLAVFVGILAWALTGINWRKK